MFADLDLDADFSCYITALGFVESKFVVEVFLRRELAD